MLAELSFRVLSKDQIKPFCQKQVVQNLHVDAAQFLVECAGHVYPSDQVPCASQGIKLHVDLASEGFSAALPELCVPVELRLSSSAINPVTVGTNEVRLSRETASADLSLAVADPFLAKAPGHYSLELLVAGRRLATYPFRLLSLADLCEAVVVEPLNVMANTRNSNRAVEVKELDPEMHETLQINFATSLAFPGHPLIAPAKVEVAAGNTVLFRSRFQVPLDAPLPLTSLRSLPVAVLWQKAGKTSRQLSIRVRIGNRIRARQVIRIARRCRLTTVEGALTVAPEQMHNVEAEYAAILTGHGMNPAAAGRE